MSRTKVKPVKNISELRYKMADVMAAIENDEIELGKANGIIKAAGIIVNACKAEAVYNYTSGVTKAIDFIEQEPRLKKVGN